MKSKIGTQKSEISGASDLLNTNLGSDRNRKFSSEEQLDKYLKKQKTSMEKLRTNLELRILNVLALYDDRNSAMEIFEEVNFMLKKALEKETPTLKDMVAVLDKIELSTKFSKNSNPKMVHELKDIWSQFSAEVGELLESQYQINLLKEGNINHIPFILEEHSSNNIDKAREYVGEFVPVKTQDTLSDLTKNIQMLVQRSINNPKNINSKEILKTHTTILKSQRQKNQIMKDHVSIMQPSVDYLDFSDSDAVLEDMKFRLDTKRQKQWEGFNTKEEYESFLNFRWMMGQNYADSISINNSVETLADRKPQTNSQAIDWKIYQDQKRQSNEDLLSKAQMNTEQIVQASLMRLKSELNEVKSSSLTKEQEMILHELSILNMEYNTKNC